MIMSTYPIIRSTEVRRCSNDRRGSIQDERGKAFRSDQAVLESRKIVNQRLSSPA